MSVSDKRPEKTPARESELSRRAWLTGAAATLFAPSAWAEPSLPAKREHLETIDLELPGASRIAKVARLLVPRSHNSDSTSRPLRTLVLLHGLGETKSSTLALKAWSELYGLVSADARLRSPPIAATGSTAKYWPEERLKQANQSLKTRPYRGFVLVCPQTPNPANFSDRNSLFNDYAGWLLDVLLPEVERRVPQSTHRVHLDGCSLGGYVGLELFLRHPKRFAAFGTVQSAIGKWRAPKYAERFAALDAQARATPLRLASSTRDPFLEANQLLSKELAKRKVAHHLDVLPGPHDQPWLRQVGTLETLRWHDGFR